MKQLRVLLVGLALTAGLLTAGTGSAHAALNDLVISHRATSAVGTILICRDWSDSGTCASNSPRGDLYRGGLNSKEKYGWADTDGFYMPSGCRAYIYYGVGYYTKSGNGWTKLSGPGTKSVRIICD